MIPENVVYKNPEGFGTLKEFGSVRVTFAAPSLKQWSVIDKASEGAVHGADKSGNQI
jgi:hypothetical protein